MAETRSCATCKHEDNPPQREPCRTCLEMTRLYRFLYHPKWEAAVYSLPRRYLRYER